MFIPQINEEVTINTEMYKGIGKVFHIDYTNQYNHSTSPIQVELDEPYDSHSSHRMLRVNMKELYEPFRIIVAGSRGFKDYKLLKTKLDSLLKNKEKSEIVIVSGTAKGADLLGEKYANDNKLLIKRFVPDWDIGKQAGHIRNADMASYADACILFWDGVSTGTASMKKMAENKELQLRVIKY